MRSSFLGLEVSKRSIQMAQKALDITGNNMSNAETKGYSRQRLDTTSLYLRSFSNWQTKLSKISLGGEGVYAHGISQIRDEYIDRRYRDMTCFAAEYNTKSKILQEVETAIDNVDNFGLLAAFDNIKNVISQTGEKQPDAREMTSIVRNEMFNVCQMLRTYEVELARLLENNVIELKQNLETVNELIRKIADYNVAIVKEYSTTEYGRIYRGEGVSEYGPLELMDQRNLLLDELSKYGNIHVKGNGDGSVQVTMGGTTIIDNEKYEQIVMREYDNFNAAAMVFSNGDSFNVQTGIIKGFVDLINGHGPYAVGVHQSSEYGIPYYKAALNAFAETFSEHMNRMNGAYRDVNAFTFNTAAGVMTGASVFHVTLGEQRADVTINPGDTPAQIEQAFNDAFGGNVFTLDPVTGVLTAIPVLDLTIAADPANPDNPDDIMSEFIMLKVDEDRLLFTSGDETQNINSSNIRISDQWMEYELLVGMVLNAETGYYELPNLDNLNLNILQLALEEPIQFGRAHEFTGSVYEYLMFISNRNAQGIEYLENQYDVAMSSVYSLLDSRDGVMAISDTEEGINMMIFQNWYNASARVMTALDECLDKVINGMGRCGL